MGDGNAVWAKLRYCSYWPAKIVDAPQNIKKIPPRKFCVYFFGSNNYGFVAPDLCVSYLESREKYVKKGRGKLFSDAVKLCDEYINNPNASNVQPSTLIQVAREFDFAIKREPENDESPWYENELVYVCKGCEDKENKLQNFEKYRQHSENEYRKEVNGLQNQIDSLVKERDILISELNRYRASNEFEVDSIIGHKLVKMRSGKEMQFLIHWKGYDETHDSWERKENLHCPAILKKYLKLHDLL